MQRLGVDGKALPHLVVKQPLLLTTSEEKVIESFKQAENLGFKQGSKPFAAAMRAFLGVGKEKMERKLCCLNSFDFSKEHISKLCSREPRILGLSEEKNETQCRFFGQFYGTSLS